MGLFSSYTSLLHIYKPICAEATQHGCCPNNLTYTQCVHQVYLDFRVGGREEHLVATWDLSAAGCFLYIMTADMAMPSEITVSMYIVHELCVCVRVCVRFHV